MAYKRTAVISSGCGGSALRSFVSETPLSVSKVLELLEDDGFVDSGNTQVYDTPEAEEVKPIILVQLRTNAGRLYLGFSTNNEWSRFYKLPSTMGQSEILELMVRIQYTNTMPDLISQSLHWLDAPSLLTTIITHDGEQILMDLGKMDEALKNKLDLIWS